MKILLCSNADNGGGTWFLASAINRYTKHAAQQFRMKQCYLDYPYHMLDPSQNKMRALIEWADVIHVREAANYLHKSFASKPVVITYSGRGFRRSAKKLVEEKRARGWMVTVSTPDLPWYYPDAPPLWIPNTREDMTDYPMERYRKFTVCHAPTFRERKGTDIVMAAVRGLRSVDLELIERATYRECLQRKARCHVLFDQFANGYGNNAIEAWALGIPVITNDLSTQFAHRLEKAVGYLPFVKAPKNTEALREIIEQLREDEAFYEEMRDKGRRFFFTYHHAPVVAKRAARIYKAAMGGKMNYPVYPKPVAVIKERELNILSLGTWDYAGCGYFLSQAINKTTPHHSRAVRWLTSRLKFPHDIYRPSLKELADLWKWADVVHIHDSAGIRSNRVNPSPEYDLMRELPPKPTVITHHGSRYRGYSEHFNQEAQANGWLQTCSTLDLTRLGARWLPDCRPDMLRRAKRWRKGFVVCHAPTNRSIKDTETVIEAMKRMSRIDGFELVENAVWSECIKRKLVASVLIDQFQLGYGCNSIEAWAMGQAVIGNASKQILTMLRDSIGYIPFVHCPSHAGQIRQAVRRLRDDEEFYKETVKRGRKCWRDFHSPKATAQKALEYYRQAMMMGPAMFARAGPNYVMPQHRGQPAPLMPSPQRKGSELVLVEYVGKNKGDMTWWGETGEKYKLGGVRRRGYVYREDVGGLLAARGKVGDQQFRVVKQG